MNKEKNNNVILSVPANSSPRVQVLLYYEYVL